STGSGRTGEVGSASRTVALRRALLGTKCAVIVTRRRGGELLRVGRNLAAFVIGDAIEVLVDSFLELGARERLAAGLGQAFGIHQQLVAQHGLELAGVHLRHEHLVEASEQLAQVPGQRPNVSDVDMADCETPLARAAYSLMDRPEGRTPADNGKTSGGS